MYKNSVQIVLLLFYFIQNIHCQSTKTLGTKDNTVPQTLLINGSDLAKNKALIAEKKNPNKVHALEELLKTADKILKKGALYSVMNKNKIPPSGDKHDYMSIGPYWWPDTTKPNGLPYIRKDGQINPEYHQISDTDEMDKVVDDSKILALAYYFTGDDRYTAHAAKVIKTWFLDPATRQNPNLNFGQGIPGINTGRGIGIIETRGLTGVLDAAILLQGSKNWTNQDHEGLQRWFADYLKWLLENPLGQDEGKAHNNHGTHYDAQVIAFALFANQIDVVKKQIEITKKRIQSQLAVDGSQPHELERTLSWNYTNMNLKGFLDNAILAQKVDTDLWQYQTTDGKSLKKCVDWLVPYLKNEKKWTHQQIKKRELENAVEILLLASKAYKNEDYTLLAKSIDPKIYQSFMVQLTY